MLSIRNPEGQPIVSHYGTVPISQAARLDQVGTNRNANNRNGDAFVVLDGGGITLDGMSMRHVILQNVTVYYQGGPLILEDVRFVNCTFILELKRNVPLLADSVLASPSVSLVV